MTAGSNQTSARRCDNLISLFVLSPGTHRNHSGEMEQLGRLHGRTLSFTWWGRAVGTACHALPPVTAGVALRRAANSLSKEPVKAAAEGLADSTIVSKMCCPKAR